MGHEFQTHNIDREEGAGEEKWRSVLNPTIFTFWFMHNKKICLIKRNKLDEKPRTYNINIQGGVVSP